MIEILPLGMNNIKEIIKIEREVFQNPWSVSIMKENLSSSINESWGIFKQNNLAGFAIFSKILDEAEILNIAINREFQNQGLGKILSKFVIDRLSKLNILKVFLEVQQNNIAAIKIYKSLGFKQINLRKNYYALNDNKFENALILALNLNEL